ncbi:hypothetical protein Hanom_Chr07g00580421 [Helianthus anomalus]
MSSLSSFESDAYVACDESEILMKNPWFGHSSDPFKAGTMLITCKRIDRCSPRTFMFELMVLSSFKSSPGVRDAIFFVERM